MIVKAWRIWLIITSIAVTGTLIYLSLTPQSRSEPYRGVELNGAAPAFQLIDQYGSRVSLTDFRGKVVILTFMDSQCKEVCPLTADQLIQTYKSLDPDEAGQVAFLAVNVNVDANSVADVLHITGTWHLEEIPAWHFLTGDPEDLGPVWTDYGIVVSDDSDTREILHTPGVFLIDPDGQMRWYISTPYSEDGNPEWTLPLSELLVNHVHEILAGN